MRRAAASGTALSHRDTRFVKGMLARGDRQHDIAAYFGVNGGRIAEVRTGDCTYPNAEPMPEADLPPPGPYIAQYALQPIIDSLNEAIGAIELAEAEDKIENVNAALALAKEALQQRIDHLEPA